MTTVFEQTYKRGFFASVSQIENAPRDFVMEPPTSMDRITFKTADDGELAGYVAAIRRHVGNGERFAWVELDNALVGQFRGVPLTDILASDDMGFDRRRKISDLDTRRLCLADFSGGLGDRLRAVVG